MVLRACVLCLSAIALASCDTISAPRCNRVSFSQASTEADTVTTTTGLRYIEGNAGEGVEVDWCNDVLLHYEGFLLDGTRFETTREADTPLLFAPGLDAVITGFAQGVIGMRPGGTRRLIIRPELGFGSRARLDANGRVVIPANSTIVYDIELLEVAQ
jgi:FKBP-type peptidyl-prolyl cis-trans isomerase